MIADILARLMNAAPAADFQIATRPIPLANVEEAWAVQTSAPRVMLATGRWPERRHGAGSVALRVVADRQYHMESLTPRCVPFGVSELHPSPLGRVPGPVVSGWNSAW